MKRIKLQKSRFKLFETAFYVLKDIIIRNYVLIDANVVSVIHSEGFKPLAMDNGLKIRNLKINKTIKFWLRQ